MSDKSERNIKFRAWSKLHKKWYTNTILIAYDGLPFAHFVKVDDDGKAVEHQVFNAGNLDLVVQQSTGLTDQNGQEIYEGDYVHRADGYTGAVEYGRVLHSNTGKAYIGFYLRKDKDNYTHIDGTLEVIGNIFEGVDK
jgi:uncharacterized phage protein (TIGR01671 family)